ncbi:hypothetical protein BT69DRAFT_1277337 [Atractiella rhizophila]|nr:hypothetical protein BT69DRAFT_1277337 [Atractiella rhizophila]
MSDEEDYLSDKFLVPSNTETTLTYSRERQKRQIASEDRGRVKSRAQREAEAREEGLRKRMGYKRGEGLGKKAEEVRGKVHETPVSSFGKGIGAGKKEEEIEQPRGGLGSSTNLHPTLGLGSGAGIGSKRPPHTIEPLSQGPPPSKKPRIDPIPIHIRSGRAGLSSSKSTSQSYTTTTPDRPADEQVDFRTTKKSDFEEKRAAMALEKARRTVVELDEREGIKGSTYWLEVGGSERDEQRARRLARRIRMGDLDGEDLDEVANVGSSAASRDGPLGYAKGLSGTVVDLDSDPILPLPEGDMAAEVWLALPPSERLKRTMRYLRERHKYCFWCGALYASQEEMEKECPGEVEEDHE